MITNGSIRHPERSAIVMRRDWQVKALQKEVTGRKKDDTAETGAELLSLLEYHHDHRAANKLVKVEVDKFQRKNPRKSYPLGDWLPYTFWYLRECLLNGRSKTGIVNAISLLESRGFISTKVPKDITDHYSTNMTWLRFLPDAVNAWIDDNCDKTWLTETGARPPRILPNIDPVVDPETAKQIAEADQLQTTTAMVNALCSFHRHIHNKNKNTIYDGKRKRNVAARINERRSMKDKTGPLFTDEEILGQCALVIIGNVVSEFHQGKDPDKNAKIYDDIELMFRDSTKFDQHMSYADLKGITAEMAFREFQGFLQGKPSRYAKQNKKIDSGASMAQRDALEDIRPEERTRYRQLARTVTSFFQTNTELKTIIEFAKTNNQVAALGKGIINDDALASAIRGQLKVFRPAGLPPEMEKAVEEFAKTFCKIQRVNS